MLLHFWISMLILLRIKAIRVQTTKQISLMYSFTTIEKHQTSFEVRFKVKFRTTQNKENDKCLLSLCFARKFLLHTRKSYLTCLSTVSHSDSSELNIPGSVISAAFDSRFPSVVVCISKIVLTNPSLSFAGSSGKI